MAKSTTPNFIPEGNEIRRPAYIKTPLNYTLHDERLAGFIFSVAAMVNLNEIERTMVISKSMIWPANNMVPNKMKDEYERLQERLMANNSFDVDIRHGNILGDDIKDASISVYEMIAHDSDYNLVIKFTPTFINLMHNIRIKKETETLVLGNLSVIKWAKRKISINFYWKICGWQAGTNQIALTIKEFLEAINSKSEKTEFWRIKEKYIEPIRKDLAETSAAFTYSLESSKKEKLLVFKFNSNYELNSQFKNEIVYDFERHLKNAGVGLKAQIIIRNLVSDRIVEETFINYTLFEAYNFLTKKTVKENNPGGYIFKAITEAFYKSKYEFLKKAGHNFALPMIPNIDSLVGSKVLTLPTPTKSAPAGREKVKHFTNLFQSVFGITSKELLAFIIDKLDIAYLIAEIEGTKQDDRREVILSNARTAFYNTHSLALTDFISTNAPGLSLIEDAGHDEFLTTFMMLSLERDFNFSPIQVNLLIDLLQNLKAA